MRSVARTGGARRLAIAVVAADGVRGRWNHGDRRPALTRGVAGPRGEAPIDTVGLPRIRFARGTTSGTIDDKLGRRAPRSYVLVARRPGRSCSRTPSPGRWRSGHPPPEPVVQVFEAATGRELTSPRGEPEVWSAACPSRGLRRSRDRGGPDDYTLAVQIPRRVEVSPAEPTAVFTGTAPSRAPIDFLVRVDAGRTLEVSLGGAPTVGLHIYGLDDGVQLSRLSDRQRLYSGRVEPTQDYVVSMVPWAERAAYDLRVTVR